MEVNLIGAGGHAKVVTDALIASGYNIGDIYDDTKTTFYSRYNVSGCIDNIDVGRGNLFCTIGDNSIRRRITSKYDTSIFVNCIHPRAVVSPSACIGIGNYIGPCAVVSSDVFIGDFNIINDGCFIGHDCIIGDYNHVCPNASLGGRVIVDNGVTVGTGATVIPDMSIGTDVVVGAGAVVINDVPEGTVVGVPAKLINRNH